MNRNQRMYASKLLLFGEYTVIQQGEALAIPYHEYVGRWSFENSETKEAVFSQNSLKKVVDYIKSKPFLAFNILQLEADLKQGLWFDSNIPAGYGLGSSGAVCAALYERYCSPKKENLMALKNDLAALENCFHGQSSGIDPLVVYTNRALQIKKNKDILKIKIPKKAGKGAIFLIDSQKARVATPLVQFYLDSAQNTTFVNNSIQPIKVAVSAAIKALLAHQSSLLLTEVEQISRLQYQYWQPMVSDSLQDIWQKGLSTQDFFLKLCGAGGGGFTLGFTADWERTKAQYLQNYKVSLLFAI